MEKLLGIVIIFAAGYLMYRLQGTAGGCCGGGHEHETGQCTGTYIPPKESSKECRSDVDTPIVSQEAAPDRERN